MSNKNQKRQKQPEQKSTPQPTTPAKPVELSEEALGQVVGGVIAIIRADLDAGANARDPGL